MAKNVLKKKPDIRQARPRAQKVSLTVSEDVLRDVAREAERAGQPLSAYVTDALARELRRAKLRAFIDDFEREHGPITEAELEEARARWRG
jgi:hypothetical protein